MYIAIESFTTKNYDVKRKQLLEDDFTTQDEIQDLLNANYIMVYDDTLEITENGQYEVTEYKFADVDVPIPQVNLQSKNITITQNGEQTVSADTGYDGLSSVNINTNVGGSDYNAKMKTTYSVNGMLGYIEEIPLIDTSSAETLANMFTSCTGLTTIPLLNTSNVTIMTSMFSACTSLTSIPLLDTSKVTNMSSMFSDCSSLTSIPLLDTSKVTTMYYMFKNCTSLTSVPLLDTSSVYDMQKMFASCNNLTDESLNNILAMCTNATSYLYTKTLRYMGISATLANRCVNLSNYQAFLDAGWTTGY